MGNEIDNKFTWGIKKTSSSQFKSIESDQFVIGGCKWRLMAYPKNVRRKKYLTLVLDVDDSKILPCGWRRHAKYRLTVVNKRSENLSQVQEARLWFDEKSPCAIYSEMIPFTKLYETYGGFLVKNEFKIVAEVEVLEVIGKLDVTEKSQEVTRPLKKIKRIDDCVVSKETSSVKERIDVKGFQVLPSQVEFVSRVFRKYPDIAVQIRAKNERLRSSCLYVFLGLIEILCKSLNELSNDNLLEADSSVNFLKCAGIKVNCFEKKLEEVKENKKEEQTGLARMQEFEETLKIFKQKYSGVNALLEKERVELEVFKKKCSDKEALVEKEKVELKDLKQKCSDKEALVEKEKVEMKNLKQKCSIIEALVEKEKAKLLVARVPPLTLD